MAPPPPPPPPPPPQGRKKSQGRRKIDMKLIPDENARTVTFSKRRAGIFKKATELSILCGAHIAIVIYSLSGRAYSFAHPNVESVAERFFNRNRGPNQHDSPQALRGQALMLARLREECERKTCKLEARKKRGKELEAALERSYGLTDEHQTRLSQEQLKDLKERLEKQRDGILGKLAKENVGPVGPSGSGNIAAAAATSAAAAAAEALVAGEINLMNVERGWSGVSWIPADWLKL